MDSLAWTTASEKRFLDNIGSFLGKTHRRLPLLKLYQQSMRNRRRWGAIDKNEINYHVQKLIDAEEKLHERMGIYGRP